MKQKKIDKRFEPAIRELIATYSAEPTDIHPPCPLCRVDEVISPKEECINCPWMVVEGSNCMYSLHRYDRVSFPIRIQRLKRWLKLIDK